MNTHSFIGAPIPGAAHDALGRVQRRLDKWAHAHDLLLDFVPDRLLMVPLHDLVDTPAVTLEAAELVMKRVAAKHAALTLQGASLDAFPSWEAPRLIHLRLDDPQGAFAAVHAALSAGLEGYGFKLDPRVYQAHVPLAQVPAGAPPLPNLTLGDFDTLAIERLSVLTRVPTADGRMAWYPHSTAALGLTETNDDSADEETHREALRQQLEERLAARTHHTLVRPPRRRNRRRATELEDDTI
jgi:2'-5' RNA ligase